MDIVLGVALLILVFIAIKVLKGIIRVVLTVACLALLLWLVAPYTGLDVPSLNELFN